ncbi:MAG: CpaD family pilus assembly protein [Hyphomicrobiales bacterium]
MTDTFAQTARRRGQSAMGKAGGVVLAALLAMSVSACKTAGGKEPKEYRFSDPTARHRITVAESKQVLDVAVPRGSSGLTRSQSFDVHRFAQAYKKEGEGVIAVQAPNGGPNELEAVRAVDDVRRILAREGLDRGQVTVSTYYGDGVNNPPLRITYARLKAHGPECGEWENLARDPQNVNYRNFGCATQRNLAAMIADPRDLLGPRGETPRSSERRDVAWDKYVKGETTISEKAQDEKSTVSEVKGGGGQ